VVVAFDRSPLVYLEFMRRRGLDTNALDRWYDLTEAFLINRRCLLCTGRIRKYFSDMRNVTPTWTLVLEFDSNLGLLFRIYFFSRQKMLVQNWQFNKFWSNCKTRASFVSGWCTANVAPLKHRSKKILILTNFLEWELMHFHSSCLKCITNFDFLLVVVGRAQI